MITVMPLNFLGQGACLQPADQQLHDLTIQYVNQEVIGGSELNLSLLNQTFVAVETDDQDKPLVVHGVTGLNTRVDIPLFRATHRVATAALHHRLHAYLADRGYLGQEVFIHLSSKESPEQRCSGFDEEILKARLMPADRYLVTVRSV